MSSLEFTIKSEMEDSFSHSSVKLENNDLVDSIGLFDDGSLFLDPDMEFKAEPEIFESIEGDIKYSFDCDASVSEEDLQIKIREVNNEEENVKTGVKEKYGIQLRSSRKENKGNVRGRGKEYLQNEEQIKNSGREKPLFQERDSKIHTDMGTREESFVCGNYEKQLNGVANHDTHMVITTGGQFRCRECGKTFCKEVNVKAHYEAHNKRRSFKCSDCGKVFFQKTLLIKHLRTHTGEKEFKCSVCAKAFSKGSYLTKHYRIHTVEKPFKCSVCNKAFIDRSDLKKHDRIHTGEKPFKCRVCDKAFSQIGHLTSHCRTHTREKPFKCSICDKAFSERSTLTIHYRIHTGEKPFKCSVCYKTFSERSPLTRHFRIHTGEKPFKCCDCDMAFTRKSFLSRHMKICAGENV